MGRADVRGFLTERAELAKAAFAAYDDLASRYDVVISEGAGSPTEINLRQSDYVNLGLAQHTRTPVVVVGDIDRGACSRRCSARSRCSTPPISR